MWDHKIRCAYLKFSVKSAKSLSKIDFKEDLNFAPTKNSRLSFKKNKITFFIFSSDRTHVNITGLKYLPSLTEVESILGACLTETALDNFSLVKNFIQIDSSSFHGQLSKKFYNLLSTKQKFVDAFTVSKIIIKKYPKFSGICLKFPDGYAITIFSSGNFSATGFKDIKNLKQSLDFLVSLQTNWECMRDFRML